MFGYLGLELIRPWEGKACAPKTDTICNFVAMLRKFVQRTELVQ